MILISLNFYNHVWLKPANSYVENTPVFISKEVNFQRKEDIHYLR